MYLAADNLSAARGPRISLGPRLVSVACEFYGLEESDLYSMRRRGPITLARWAVARVLIDEAGWSQKRVAKLLGKDSKAVCHGYARSQNLVWTDPLFSEAVTRLKDAIFS